MKNMQVVNQIISDVKIPRMIRVRQIFEDVYVPDVRAEVLSQLESLDIDIKPGMTAAITAGSRGVKDATLVIKTVADFLKSRGAEPFIVPAMGSHGGATAEGQIEIMKGFGVTEESMGCRVKATMEVVEIAKLPSGRPVYMDKNAAEADCVIPINRVKTHTGIVGRYESGLMKILTVGLGKQRGAEMFHSEKRRLLSENIETTGRAIIKSRNVLFGVALVENAHERTHSLHVIKGVGIPEIEPGLLEKSKSLMPAILFEDIDLFIVDRIGKEISGAGVDPNIVRKFAAETEIDNSRMAKRMTILDITDASKGVGLGVGMADTTTWRLLSKFDFGASYPNAITSTSPEPARIPMVLDNQKHAIQCALKTYPQADPENYRIVRMPDSLHITEIEISEALLPEAIAHPQVEVLSEPYELVFDENGDLFADTYTYPSR